MSELITLHLPSDLKYLDLVYSVTQSVSQYCDLDERQAHHLQVVVSEGYTNAVIHGNKGHSGRYVVLTFERTSSFLRISVEDEGVVPIVMDTDHTPILPGPMDETGRGLLLISTLSEDFELLSEPSRGNKLNMTFRLDKNLEMI